MGVLAAQADGRGADYRHEPPQVASGPRARIRRHRHHRRARRRRASARIRRAHRAASAPIRCSNASARRNRCNRRSLQPVPAAIIGYVGVPHGGPSTASRLFFAQSNLLGWPCPGAAVACILMDLAQRFARINPGKVFDLELLDRRCRCTATRPWTSAAPSRCC